IREDNPPAARRVAETIYDSVQSLKNFPYRGRIGVLSDTRELVFAPWPTLLFTKSSKVRCKCCVFATPRRTGLRAAGPRPTYSPIKIVPQVTFEIQAECPVTRARAGILHTAHGDIETPVFMPVGTQATVKGLSQRDLAE